MAKGKRHPVTGRRMNGKPGPPARLQLPPQPTLSVSFFDNENPKILSKPFVVLTTPPQSLLTPDQARAFGNGLLEQARRCEVADEEFKRLSLAFPDERAKLLAMEAAFPEEVANKEGIIEEDALRRHASLLGKPTEDLTADERRQACLEAVRAKREEDERAD